MLNINYGKKDKRILRELMHLGLERECQKYVKSMLALAERSIPLAELNAPYQEVDGRSVEGPWHKRYIQLFRKTMEFDKHVARRYDGAQGARCLDCVLDLYCDDLISDEEIAGLSDEVREFLIRCKSGI